MSEGNLASFFCDPSGVLDGIFFECIPDPNATTTQGISTTSTTSTWALDPGTRALAAFLEDSIGNRMGNVRVDILRDEIDFYYVAIAVDANGLIGDSAQVVIHEGMSCDAPGKSYFTSEEDPWGGATSIVDVRDGQIDVTKTNIIRISFGVTSLDQIVGQPITVQSQGSNETFICGMLKACPAINSCPQAPKVSVSQRKYVKVGMDKHRGRFTKFVQADVTLQQTGLTLFNLTEDFDVVVNKCGKICDQEIVCEGFTIRKGNSAMRCTRLKETAGFYNFVNSTLETHNYRVIY